MARTLAKTLNCQQPKTAEGKAVDCCDKCAACRKIDAETHGDMHWVRPESKSRIVSVDQMRELMREIQLKPNDAEFKVAVIVRRLPKTRSGKIVRGTIKKIADGLEYKVPATIDDPAILDEIKADLASIGYPRP